MLIATNINTKILFKRNQIVEYLIIDFKTLILYFPAIKSSTSLACLRNLL